MDWEDINQFAGRIELQLKQQQEIEKYDMLYCIGRGAMVLTRMLSGMLNINIHNIHMIPASRDKRYSIDAIKEPCIFVDDILDTGETFFSIVDTCRIMDKANVIFTFLVGRRKTFESVGHVKKVIFGKILEHDNYVVFPWEVFDADSPSRYQ
jgi:hypoxanthine phosphoribosyltransferase